MTCHEARKLLYDVQVSRETPADQSGRDERASLLLLAKAHLHVCVACNDYFERERELARSLRDRISHLTYPMPQEVLAGVLKAVHDARMEEVGERSKPKLIGWLRSLFSK